jgi:DNA-directed RNA polymerase II subunit RPB1
MTKRPLTQTEIEDICSVLRKNPFISKDVSECILENLKINIRKQLKNVQVYPQNIPKLKEQVLLQFERSQIDPSESVGCIAASSIGADTTQQSLNSFHSAGIGKANLTGGLVRQNELLNASKKVKTPSCSIYLNKDMIDVTDLYKVKEFVNSNIRYYEMQDIITDYNIENNPIFDENEEKYYNMFGSLFDDSYKECEWRLRLTLNVDSIYKIKKDLMYVACCIYSCIDEARDYLSIVFFPDETGRLDIWIKDNIEEPDTYISSSKKKKIEVTEDHKDVIYNIVNSENKILKFIKNILIPTLKLVPISGIFGIEECYFTQEKGGEWMIDTKGSNYKEIIYQPYVDYKRTKSNNMWDNFEMLGIEGAHKYLLDEFGKIIKVNKRHLDILIDSMTQPGKIMSVSRYGIDRKQVGPLAKACFEQPIENFLISAAKGERDEIQGVTASITLGKLSRMGTGSMDLIIDTDKIFGSLPVKGDTRTPDVYGGGFFEDEALDENKKEEEEESDIEVEYSEDEALDENEEECVY